MTPLRVVPLGGLGEIGMNMMLLEYGDDAILVDCGFSFPDETTPGVDLILPNFAYAIERRDSIRALFLTHAHEDHIGATPFLLRHLDVPVYATPFTLLMLRRRAKEFGPEPEGRYRDLVPDEPVLAGGFHVTATAVTHSVPDAVALIIQTGAGKIIHTGDFKIDHTPVDGRPIDLAKFARYAEPETLLLLSDSTGATTPGSTPTERAVSVGLEEVLSSSVRRVIVTTISSHVHRLQQLFDIALRCGRRVEVIGRSLISTVEIAEKHGYLKRPLTRDGFDRALILVTGSQGEDRAALARIARDENRELSIEDGDVVVFSARTIPGNEASVAHVIDGLYRRGATVVDDKVGANVHVSGHAAQDDLRLMIRLVRPKFFIPVHGTIRHMVEHARLATECGVDATKTLVALNGDVIEIDGETIRKAGFVTAGKQFLTHTTGAVADAVLFDRLTLADAGFVVVVVSLSERRLVQPSTVVTRGLMRVDDNRAFLAEVSAAVDALVEHLFEQGADFETIRAEVRAEIARKLALPQGREPLIVSLLLDM